MDWVIAGMIPSVTGDSNRNIKRVVMIINFVQFLDYQGMDSREGDKDKIK